MGIPIRFVFSFRFCDDVIKGKAYSFLDIRPCLFSYLLTVMVISAPAVPRIAPVSGSALLKYATQS